MTRRSTHRWVVDGISDGMARIEEDGERMIVVPAYLLPASVREGQVFEVASAAGRPGALVVTVTSDEAAAVASLAKSKATMARAMSKSRKRDPGGDVAL